jgi:hypothetical protein
VGGQRRREGILVKRQYQVYPFVGQTFKIATTDSNHGHKVYPNLLAGFQLKGINQAWVAHSLYSNWALLILAALLDR